MAPAVLNSVDVDEDRRRHRHLLRTPVVPEDVAGKNAECWVSGLIEVTVDVDLDDKVGGVETDLVVVSPTHDVELGFFESHRCSVQK